MASSSGCSRLVALVVGIANYQSHTALPSCDHDAKTMAANLDSLGWSVTCELDLDGKALAECIAAFIAQSKQHRPAMTLFYFSGHGMQYTDNDLYLLAGDFDCKAAAGNTVMPWVGWNRELFRAAFKVQDVMEGLENSRCPCNILVLDCCRTVLVPGKDVSEPLGESMRYPTRQDEVEFLILYAVRSNKEAVAAGAGQLSPFTKNVVQKLFLDLPNQRYSVHRALTLAQKLTRQDVGPDKRPELLTSLSLPFEEICVDGQPVLQPTQHQPVPAPLNPPQLPVELPKELGVQDALKASGMDFQESTVYTVHNGIACTCATVLYCWSFWLICHSWTGLWRMWMWRCAAGYSLASALTFFCRLIQRLRHRSDLCLNLSFLMRFAGVALIVWRVSADPSSFRWLPWAAWWWKWPWATWWSMLLLGGATTLVSCRTYTSRCLIGSNLCVVLHVLCDPQLAALAPRFFPIMAIAQDVFGVKPWDVVCTALALVVLLFESRYWLFFTFAGFHAEVDHDTDFLWHIRMRTIAGCQYKDKSWVFCLLVRPWYSTIAVLEHYIDNSSKQIMKARREKPRYLVDVEHQPRPRFELGVVYDKLLATVVLYVLLFVPFCLVFAVLSPYWLITGIVHHVVLRHCGDPYFIKWRLQSLSKAVEAGQIPDAVLWMLKM